MIGFTQLILKSKIFLTVMSKHQNAKMKMIGGTFVSAVQLLLGFFKIRKENALSDQ
jgi:hypothetical protein